MQYNFCVLNFCGNNFLQAHFIIKNGKSHPKITNIFLISHLMNIYKLFVTFNFLSNNLITRTFKKMYTIIHIFLVLITAVIIEYYTRL